MGHQRSYALEHTDLELTLNTLLIPLPVVLLDPLVVLQRLDELLPQKFGLYQKSAEIFHLLTVV